MSYFIVPSCIEKKAEGVDMSCSLNVAYHGTTTFERDEIFREVYLYVILKYDTCPS